MAPADRAVDAQPAPPSSEQVLEALRAQMKSEFGLSDDDLDPSNDLFDDLDLDSIDVLDLAAVVEEANGLRLPEEDLKSVRTIQDAADVIHAAHRAR